MEKVPYREAVGSLLWLSNGTRPDISYAVSQVAKYMSNSGMEHWKAVKRILRYLNGTMDRKIVYNGKSNTIKVSVMLLLILILTTVVESVS